MKFARTISYQPSGCKNVDPRFRSALRALAKNVRVGFGANPLIVAFRETKVLPSACASVDRPISLYDRQISFYDRTHTFPQPFRFPLNSC